MQGQTHIPGSTPRSIPNRRDLRKYARLFVRTDQDSDGFISSDEAYSLLTRSQVPEDALQHIWTLSNVSGSGMLSFPEFIAAMHLIREARQTQQAPTALSAELSSFLGGVSESPLDLAREGSSRSAQLLASQAAGAAGPPPLQQAQQEIQAQQVQQEIQQRQPQEMQGTQAQEPQGLGACSPHFGHADAVATAGFPDGEAFPEGGKKKGRKKGKKERERETKETKETSPQLQFQEPAEAEAAEAPAAWGTEPAPAPEAFEGFGQAWTSFGGEEKGPEEKEEEKGQKERKERKEKKDRSGSPERGGKDEKTRSQLEADASWSLPAGDGWSAGPTVPNYSQTPSTSPQSRLGLRFDLDFGKDADPDYAARLQEILTGSLPSSKSSPSSSWTSPVSPEQKVPGSAPATVWAGRRNDGHFEQRYQTAYKYLGDYASPSLHVALMGFRSPDSGPAVLPAPARPFLKSLTPHFTAGHQARSHMSHLESLGTRETGAKGLRSLTFAPMTAA